MGLFVGPLVIPQSSPQSMQNHSGGTGSNILAGSDPEVMINMPVARQEPEHPEKSVDIPFDPQASVEVPPPHLQRPRFKLKPATAAALV